MPETFDPLDFWRLARDLVGEMPNEAALRTAVSRTYYAMFLIARDWTGVTDRRDVHRRVLQELGKRNQQGIGSQLNDLRVLREVADYQRQPYEPDHQDWQHNWQVASAIAMRILSRYERLRIIPRVTI